MWRQRRKKCRASIARSRQISPGSLTLAKTASVEKTPGQRTVHTGNLFGAAPAGPKRADTTVPVAVVTET
jgi:hypothetical protein